MITLFTLFFACSPDKENLDEICDGIDNNGDGRIDEKLYYVTFDNDLDKGINYRGGGSTRHLSAGVRYLEKWVDGYKEDSVDESTGETITTLVSQDGEGDRVSHFYLDEEGNTMHVEIDRDSDGFPEELTQHTRDTSVDRNITETLWFQESALYNLREYSWTNNTPTGEALIASQYIYGFGMEVIWEVENEWTPTSLRSQARNYLSTEQSGTETQQSYFFVTIEREYENGLAISQWRTMYLEEYFGNPIGEGSIYEQYYTEYRYNEDETLSEIEQWKTQDQSLTYPLDTSTPGLLTELNYDENGHLIHYKESSPEGTNVELRYTRENGLPVFYELDLNGDGSIDYEYTLQYDGDIVTQANETVYDSEVYTTDSNAETRYIYDENKNLIRIEIDADGDGATDIIEDYVLSCDTQAYSFDPADYDYGN